MDGKPRNSQRINKLNDLSSSEWLKFQKSWFVHNPPPRNKKVLTHPAKFPETLIQEFIEFFTKKGMNVLDPMVGTGSTLIACIRSGRNGYGIELNKKYLEVAEKTFKFLSDIVFVDNQLAPIGQNGWYNRNDLDSKYGMIVN